VTLSLLDVLPVQWAERRREKLVIKGDQRLSAGASAETSVLDVLIDGRESRLVLQTLAGRQFGSGISRREQARIQSLAFAYGVPTAEILLTLEPTATTTEGFVSRFLPGETLGRKIVSDPALDRARERLTEQCAEALAHIHAIPLAEAEWLPRRPAAVQIEELANIHRSYGDALPVFELAISWLDRHLPLDSPDVVVHGDFRNGNFIVGPEGLIAVLDWELAHRGHPMEDLGWLCQRAWRFGKGRHEVGGFGDREAFYECYERASGRRVDREAVHFWEVLGTLKWGVICQWFGRQYLDGEVRSIERLAIGRRVSEVEFDLLELIGGHADASS
jgi:aminoglycoside phosphotransferase (APT) family kinase protein